MGNFPRQEMYYGFIVETLDERLYVVSSRNREEVLHGLYNCLRHSVADPSQCWDVRLGWVRARSAAEAHASMLHRAFTFGAYELWWDATGGRWRLTEGSSRQKDGSIDAILS
jgi:hypothetical protein